MNLKLLHLVVVLFWPFLAFLPACAQETQCERALVIDFVDAPSVNFVLPDDPKICFADDKLVVKSSCVEVAYDLSTVSNFHFADVQTQLVEVNKSDLLLQYLSSELVRLSGVNALQATLYHADGAVVRTYTIQSGTVDIDLSGLLPGIYVLQLSDLSTFKLIKR